MSTALATFSSQIRVSLGSKQPKEALGLTPTQSRVHGQPVLAEKEATTGRDGSLKRTDISDT
jgi:hypothetical protein